MAILGLDEIKKRVKSQKLVENLGKRDLENPEGVGLDLRLGAVHKIIEGGAYIEVDGEGGLGKRKGVKTKVIASFKDGSKIQEEVIIEPGKFYLVETWETINTPDDLMPMLYPRSSLFRAGLLLLNTKTDPGYKGKLVMGLRNLSEYPVKFQMGARICNIVFHKIEGKTVKYRGQNQGGRITAQKAERQV